MSATGHPGISAALPPASGSIVPAGLEAEIERIGREIDAAFPASARHPLRALDRRLMEAVTGDPALRAALFRTVDVRPACRSLDELGRHLTEYLEAARPRPKGVGRAAMQLGRARPARLALGALAALGTHRMGRRFIAGESPNGALPVLASQWKRGIATSVDLLGEATLTADEADRYAARCAEAIETVAATTPSWPARPRLEADGAGALPRSNLSVKVSALTPLLRAQAPGRGASDAARRLRPLLTLARDQGVHLHVDMESLDSLETTLVVLDLLADEQFSDGPSTGLVVQAYLLESPSLLDRILAWASKVPRASPLTVRLVKGAYWDQEMIETRRHGWPMPVFERKVESDECFEKLTRRLLGARPLVRVAVASHNLRSVAHAIAYDRLTGGDGRNLELQVLRGLGDDLAEALAARGFRVRAYCPVGNPVAGMAYLVRRLLENTSNDSFLRERARGATLDQLLAPPR